MLHSVIPAGVLVVIPVIKLEVYFHRLLQGVPVDHQIHPALALTLHRLVPHSLILAGVLAMIPVIELEAYFYRFLLVVPVDHQIYMTTLALQILAALILAGPGLAVRVLVPVVI